MGIEAAGVTFSYADHTVLQDIRLQVCPGEHAGILGVSGGGKSTLLKLLAGLYAPQTGEIIVHGASTPKAIRRQVAMVMQDAMLFPASIRENITCGHPVDPAALQEACDAAQLTAWVATLPQGLDTFVGERGGKVSGGQAQRISIARAIVKRAPVILLDEATGALDSDTGGSVLQALAHLMAGKTVVSVTHHPDTLAGFDSIYRLAEGRLIHA